MAYTTSELLAKVKLWGAVPASQPAFTDAQLLGLLTDELWSNVAPFIMQFREEFFVTYQDFTITTGTRGYNIPTRTVNGVLREIKTVNSSGDEFDIPRVSPERTQRSSYGFYLENNKVYLIENDSYTDRTLRMYYYRRPSELVETTDCAQVTSVGTTTFDVSAIPSAMVSGETVDIVQATPPFNILSQDITATWVGTTVTPSSMPTGLAVGDWMCKDQESCIAQIPLETQPLLVQAVVVRINEILDDAKGLKLSTEKYDKIKESLRELISPRVVGETKAIINDEDFFYGNMYSNKYNWI